MAEAGGPAEKLRGGASISQENLAGEAQNEDQRLGMDRGDEAAVVYFMAAAAKLTVLQPPQPLCSGRWEDERRSKNRNLKRLSKNNRGTIG